MWWSIALFPKNWSLWKNYPKTFGGPGMKVLVNYSGWSMSINGGLAVTIRSCCWIRFPWLVIKNWKMMPVSCINLKKYMLSLKPIWQRKNICPGMGLLTSVWSMVCILRWRSIPEDWESWPVTTWKRPAIKGRRLRLSVYCIVMVISHRNYLLWVIRKPNTKLRILWRSP